MIFDTHAHYDDEAFNTDREEVLSGLSSRNIGNVVNIGVDIPTCEASLQLAEKYSFIYAAIGYHPSDTARFTDRPREEYLDWLYAHVFSDPESALSRKKELTALDETGKSPDINVATQPERNKRVVAIGEIGLDYHWSESDEENQNQQWWFRRQIALAKEVGLPIVVHSREAAADTMDIIREEHAADCGGIIHCYSYSAEQAVQYVDMGFYIGVGGVVTFKNARRLIETVEAVPLDRIVLETDCPYLAPEPYRGKRNDSGLIPYIAAEIAAIKCFSVDEVIRQTTINAERVYRI